MDEGKKAGKREFEASRNFISIFSVLAVVMAAAVFFALLTTASGSAHAKNLEIVPDFELETLEGKFILSDFRGRVVVLFFSFVG